MPNARERALATIREVGIIPVIRVDDAKTAGCVAEALIAAGLAIVEVTLSVPNADQVISSIVKKFGGQVLAGAGTVTDAEGAQRAIGAGAQFIVTPCLVPEVISVARKSGVAVLPGAFTPTEIFTAHQLGGDMIKVFPIGTSGAAYVRSLRGPFPDIPLVPTGGVTLENIGQLFEAGAAAVGVGSELIPRDAIARGDYAAIGAMARRFLAARPVRRASS